MERHFQEDEIEIDLRELYFAVKGKLLQIVAVSLLFGVLACGVTQFLITPVYTSTSSILVLTKETTLASLADLQMGSQLTKDYSVLITSRPVLDTVIDHLGLETDYKGLRQMITVENPADTRILNIAVNNADAELATEIVNELADVSSEFIADKMEVTPPKIIEEGEIPTGKTSPSMSKNVLLGLLLGFMLSAGVVCLLTVLDDTIKSEDDIQKYLNLPMLACVPDRKDYISGKGNSKKKRKKKS